MLTLSPLLDITLPKPIVIPTLHLTGLYSCMLGIDYVLLHYQDKLVISKRTLRLGLTVLHGLVPLVVVSPFQPNNVAFAAIPWFLASYSAYFPTKHFTLTEWMKALYGTIIDDSPLTDKSTNTKLGVWKTLRGLFKLGALYFGIEPLLPNKADEMLRYSWLSKESLIGTFLFGLKAYLILGVVDVTTGLAQTMTGWRMIDMFDSPLLATSPRDFWSRRWNKTVRNLLHRQVFSMKKEDKKSSKQEGFFSTRQGRGLLAFIISGLFHELIIISVCRRLTLENFCFFGLHGIVCMLEVKYFNNAKKPKGWKRVTRIIGQLSFMTLTGRLFLAPFLRTRFTHVLPLTHFKQ
ncbi:uncharacterized protein BX663DRAFT_504321 [Cokeromyces recurvatus]|uniref:uncharacterized protein n=1 Tax=Cokeromyces recurvatus TaxID=90255 RepID=UPI00221FEB5C|nr:uncharacterized protein BX663DRAFT_504321 [Cokeromyces recurvatus]KAI7904213.1 hypothetical protein BX663DRAFT_504321 [Cokeromyces recurvatus]